MRPIDAARRNQALQQLANYALFDRAQDSSVSRMIRDAALWEAERGDLLVQEGAGASSVCVLLEGTARIFHASDDGREFTPKIMAAPNHFGDLELLAGLHRNGQSVEALTDGVLAAIPWETVRELLLTDHHLCVGWLAGIASQFVHTIDGDRHQVFTSLAGRVANVLVSYGEVLGVPRGEGVEIAVPLSREGLARQVGSVKRSVVRVVQDFAARGLVDTSGPRLVITRMRELLGYTLPRRLGLGHRARAGGLLDPIG